MSISQASEHSDRPTAGSLTSGPGVSGLSLNSEISGISLLQGLERPPSPDPTGNLEQPSGKKKRSRRTQKEMAVYRAEQVQIKKLKAQEKRAKTRGRVGHSRRSTQPSIANTLEPSAPASSQPLVPDVNPPFNGDDYENVCGYLEEEANYTRLYGDGSKTTVGVTKVTKAAAYDIFAIFINDNSSHPLRLTGSQLRQRVDGYKKRFMKAKEFAENTGAGLEEGDGLPTLAEVLEKKCPCYERMYAIFGGKANVTALAQFDSGVGADLYDVTTNARDPEDFDSSPEVFFSGWEESQRDRLPSELNTPSSQVDLSGLASALRPDTERPLPNINASGEVNEDELPPPLDFRGTAMDPSPSLMTQRSMARATPRREVSVSPTTTRANTPATSGPLPLGDLTSSRRAFANQRSTDASPAGPHREINPKSRSTMASAYESSNTEKFSYLQQHMAWEKEKENNRLAWEKERYRKEEAKAKNGEEARMKLADKKMEAARDLLNQGSTAAEVEALLKTIYG
ncbi:uncharacterized protein PGTG_21060 [Puccinia graminis f. sp. tritici CRL 75-36-700-3]|uniref:Uncharacterized protein n=1 Tax=Puccinia graminis f. sp. tritici (strain CRL 75-36-700-3 / race SCCL) TaxID=418459 RepID=H6QQ87_PUCGT|nr:uncharacterized protein PGTG_21060 [Puccinia graminis f. sp. tritici CRL 75-36-700-3]EHS64802.1 hypothetical protein PGTG_21060 [Puccinia graminis f. sp. tritici CRL 75-36-700-3]